MLYFADGPLKGMYESAKDVPGEITGYTEDLTEYRNRGCCVHRAELDNQPEFKGYIGPMWDGGMLRYETPELYDMLSR